MKLAHLKGKAVVIYFTRMRYSTKAISAVARSYNGEETFPKFLPRSIACDVFALWLESKA